MENLIIDTPVKKFEESCKENFNYDIRNEDGTFKSMYDVLSDLHDIWCNSKQ